MVMRPLEPAELIAQCDLAGEVKVLEIEHNAYGRAIAKLRFTKIVKGRVKRAWGDGRKVARVQLRGSSRDENGVPMLGSWSDYYEPGSAVFTHLVWNSQDGAYETSWWNAVRAIGYSAPRPNWFSDFAARINRFLERKYAER